MLEAPITLKKDLSFTMKAKAPNIQKVEIGKLYKKKNIKINQKI